MIRRVFSSLPWVLLAQVRGSKELLLFPPEDLGRLRYTARPKGTLRYAWPDRFTREPIDAAAMDATAHDPPKDFEVQGYPTIYFVPKGGKPVSYDGGRDLDSMVEYIKGNAVTIKDEL